MKSRIQNLFITLVLLAGVHQATALPFASFTQPTNGQQIVTFTNLAGTALPNGGTIQQVAFSIYNQSTGQWWNGTNFQGNQTALPVTLTGTNWVPAASLVLPQPGHGQTYQLQATVTNTDTSFFTTNITVQAETTPPVVAFTSPTNSQQIVNFSNIAGTVADIATVQQVTFSIYNQNSGQWWNGTNFQGNQTALPVTLTGTNWSPASSVGLPAICCGQYYQLSVTVTDALANVGITTITVQSEKTPPVITFAPLANGEVASNLSAIGGSVTDSFTSVASVVFTIWEQDINGGPGRWWNGTNFQGSLVMLPASISGTNWSPTSGFVFPALNSGQSYQIMAMATDALSNSASATITVQSPITVLNWDPGQTPLGTMVLQNPNTNGGNYWFQIIPHSPAVGVWRTALNVTAGEADVYLSQGAPPANTNNFNFGSHRVGSDGFVVDSSQFQPGQNWYILVNASTNAQWNLVTGDIYVYPLGTLATNCSSSTNASIGAEGMIFYQTTIPSTTLAWQLWINGAPNSMYVKKSVAPDPVSYDLTQSGQMLVVPPYLAGGTFNGTYFIGVSGNPGMVINLDSRQQPVTSLPFSSLTNVVVTATNFPYVTYLVQVPVQQIAWQLNLTPTIGNPSVSVRRDLVPNEFRNDAFSETPQNVGASVTLVPPPPNSGSGVPGLSDGTFYVTVYSTSPYACAFNNANPVITPEPYVFQATNDDPNRAGWRYYVLTNINQQLGSLGWQLSLANQVLGSEIAIRRNAVPGQWSYRNNDDNYYSTSLGYVDLSSTYGLLQQPGHQADIWYIGVYTPTNALGGFVLNGSLLTGQPMPLDGAGSSVTVTNQQPGQWGFFQITVPSDTNLLGWDIRLVGVTNGSPQMVVSRDTLPTALNTTFYYWPSPYYYQYSPNIGTNWPSGNQWLNSDWTGCGTVRMLEMGLGNPLQAGTYYIGVQDPNNVSSYTLQSRGIGLTNYTIAVKDLSFTGSATNSSLNAAEGDYYRVTVPSNAPDWKLHLSAVVGDTLLKVQQNYLPNSGDGGNYEYSWPYGYVDAGLGGQLMNKPGDEQWALLPENGYNLISQNRADGTNLVAGTYYVLVASQGQNGNGCWGTNSTSYTLSSGADPVTVLPNTLSYGSDLLYTNAQAGGEMKFYQFSVPAGVASIEVRLQNVMGNPMMYLNTGSVPVGTSSGYYGLYGNYGGTNYQWNSGNLITIPNPTPGTYSLSVYGSTDNSGNYPNAGYVLQVSAPFVPQLSFSSDFDSGSLTNVISGVLADTESAFYQVNVPSVVNGAPVLGWKLDLTALNGTPSMRVRQNLLPDNNSYDGTSPFNTTTATIVPPYLTPGTWYVEVNASGSTTYSLISSVITTNTLKHPAWVMPAAGQPDTAPGLTLPMIGDSGVDPSGNPLPGDQGIDLKQGQFDFYAVIVPTNNTALLRTELQAISGNPNLYLRVGAAPTLAHYSGGYYDIGNYSRTPLYDRSLTGGTTEYANWVPLDGRYNAQLTNGLWVIAVQAGGNANVRYRLQLSCGNSVTNGLVQDLALNGGSFTNQNLNGGDWRYYRIQISDPAPTNWLVNFSRTLGSARMFVRDTSPPGDGNIPSPGNYASSSYNPGPWYTGQTQDLESWSGDGKNQGPYPRYDSPGTYSLTTPPLRPGDVYYLGFWSPVDSTFSVSSATNGGTINVTNAIAFNGGSITNVIPGYGTLMYRMDVPASATRILFNASNSANVVISLEQGTIALTGGPAHWTSYLYNNSQYGNQANASLNQILTTPNNWPWLPGYSYYLTITNTSPIAENFGFTMGVPVDLAPVVFTAPTSVTATAPDPLIQVIWGVTNQGPASASGGWYDAVWFSTNGVLDANSIVLGYFWVDQTVPVHGSYWQTNSVTLPMGASGNFTLFVQVDVNNSIYEANLGDKVSAGVSGTFTLTPPDLKPVYVVAPATVIATNLNPVIQVAWGVTNQGIGPVTGGWYDTVWFSTNGVLDANSVDAGDFYFNQGVPVGGSYSQTNLVTLPPSLGGTYHYTLFVQVDTYNYVYESNKSNNIAGPVTVRVMPPLVFNASPAGMRWTSNGFQLQLDGLAGSLVIYASTNLTSWTPIYTNPTASGSIQFIDFHATNFPLRFYRAAEQ
jgi:hypothetical protein